MGLPAECEELHSQESKSYQVVNNNRRDPARLLTPTRKWGVHSPKDLSPKASRLSFQMAESVR